MLALAQTVGTVLTGLLSFMLETTPAGQRLLGCPITVTYLSFILLLHCKSLELNLLTGVVSEIARMRLGSSEQKT